MNGAVSWLGAWLIVIVGMIAIAQTKWGRTIVYYLLWTAVLLLLVTHSSELTSIMTQGGIIPVGQDKVGQENQTEQR